MDQVAEVGEETSGVETVFWSDQPGPDSRVDHHCLPW